MKSSQLKSISRHVHSRAFTLIEILVVIVILGIAAAMVVPQLNNTGSLGVQGAARMIVSDLLYAQNEAISRQSSFKFTFDKTNNKYTLFDSEDNVVNVNWKGGDFVSDFEKDTRFQGIRIESVSFNSTSSISFDELGAPSSGGTIEVIGGTDKYRITVAEFTGRVSIIKVDEAESS